MTIVDTYPTTFDAMAPDMRQTEPLQTVMDYYGLLDMLDEVTPAEWWAVSRDGTPDTPTVSTEEVLKVRENIMFKCHRTPGNERAILLYGLKQAISSLRTQTS
ncbi:hypothetical protein BH09PAT3_BH09PAT3_2600 [soil metagenome]